MTRDAIELTEANQVISDARRLAYGSNKYASKEERQAMANQAGAVAAAELATHHTVPLPARQVQAADGAEQQGTVEQGSERGRA